jgi:MoaA/NifB/PqqE/SkfB family radical SAM enzyme
MELKMKTKIITSKDEQELEIIQSALYKMQTSKVYPTTFEFPLTIQYDLTGKCNNYCKHCYNNSGEACCVDRITPSKWQDVTKEIISYGGIFKCRLSGGEPLLLGDELILIMDILHENGTSFVIMTNGNLLNNIWIEKFKKYRISKIQISIDSSEESYHDYFRGKTNSWRQAVEAATMVAQAGFPLLINHVVTPANIDKILNMADLAYSLGASSIVCSPVFHRGRAKKTKGLMLDFKQKTKFKRQIQEATNLYSNKLEVNSMNSLKHELTKCRILPCSSATIRSDGEVIINCMIPISIGNIFVNDINHLWKNKGINFFNQAEVINYIESVNE